MKPLDRKVTPPEVFSRAVISHPTARQRLILDLMLELHPLDVNEFARKANDVLSKYDIRICDSKAVISEIPKDLIGKTVKINYAPAEATPFDFEGEILQVLYRDTAYDFSFIQELFKDDRMSSEQKDLMKYSIYEETKPKIYHRLVLNDKKQGILIIPYLIGVNIEQE